MAFGECLNSRKKFKTVSMGDSSRRNKDVEARIRNFVNFSTIDPIPRTFLRAVKSTFENSFLYVRDWWFYSLRSPSS